MHLTMHHMGTEYVYPLTYQDSFADIYTTQIKSFFNVSFLNFLKPCLQITLV